MWVARPRVCDRWSRCDVEPEGTRSPLHGGPHLLLVLSRFFLSATSLAVMRWAEDYHLFVFGALALIAGWIGRSAVRRRWPYWTRMHITGMGLSYTLMLVAFYVDNGPKLPLWKVLPHFTYWLLPLSVGLPLIIHALTSHPLQRLGDPAQ